MVMPLALVLATLPQAIDWVSLGSRYQTAWKAGRVHLQAPKPRSNPRMLPSKHKSIRELVRARGDSFYWNEEAELSFVCTGLAASMKPAAAELLFTLGRSSIGKTGRAELRHKQSLRKQPWLVRHTALRAIANGNDPRIPKMAHALLTEGDVSDSIDTSFACAVLARRGSVEHRLAIEALTRHSRNEVRVAALHALAGIGAELSLERLDDLLRKDSDVSVRCAAWYAAARCIAGLGKPDKRRQNDAADAIVDTALARLGEREQAHAERVAICRFLWDARPLRVLRKLPELLANEQASAGGDPTLRAWIWGLLQDMHGTGTERRPSRKSGKLGTGFSAREDEPEKWAEFLRGRRKLYALDRGREVLRHRFPEGTPSLLGLPVRGRRLLWLLDCSAAGAASWEGKTRVLDHIKDAFLTAVASLEDATSLRIVAYSKSSSSWPSRGYARLDAQGRSRLKAFVDGLKPTGPSDHATALLSAAGLRSAAPIEVSRLDPNGPHAVYWIVTSPPEAGRIQSPRGLVDIVLSAQPSRPLPFHIAYFADRRRRKRDSELNRRLRGLSRTYRRLATETRGSYEYHKRER